MALAKPRFNVLPALAQIRKGNLKPDDYYAHLPFEVELGKPIGDTAARALERIYAGWQKRIEEETYEDVEDVEDRVPIRFDGLTVSGSVARGGVTRNIGGAKACLWAIEQLTKRKDVVAVRFMQAEDAERAAPVVVVPDEPNTHPDLPRGLDLSRDDGQGIARLTFGITLLTDRSFLKCAKGVLACYQRFLTLCPRERLRWWADENSSVHKPIKKTTFDWLPTWLGPKASTREFISLELTDGERPQDPAKFGFKVHSDERGEDGDDEMRVLHMSFPAPWAFTRPNDLAALVRDVAAAFPYTCGSAGLIFECSRYLEEDAHKHAWAKALEHPGLDIFASALLEDVGKDAVAGVNWITLVSDRVVKRLGGAALLTSAIGDAVHVERAGVGIMIRAGDRPAVDGEAYRPVYRALAPLIERGFSRTGALDLDHATNDIATLRFQTRLDPWSELVAIEKARTTAEALIRAVTAGEVVAEESALQACLAAIDELGALKIPEARREVLGAQIAEARNHLWQELERSLLIASRGRKDLARPLYEILLRRQDAPDALYAKPYMRSEGRTIFVGLLPSCLEAGDLETIRRHTDEARRRARKNPALAHFLARCALAEDDLENALGMCGLAARQDYDDRDDLRDDPELARVHALAEFVIVTGLRPKRAAKKGASKKKQVQKKRLSR